MAALVRAFGFPRLASAFLALFLCLAVTAAAADEKFDSQPLTIVTKGGKSHAFTVELAVTPRQREQGLMNRHEMAADHGMLFAFGETRQVFMWMKTDVVASPVRLGPALGLAVGVSLVATLALGMYPGPVFEWAEASARALGTAAPALTLK